MSDAYFIHEGGAYSVRVISYTDSAIHLMIIEGPHDIKGDDFWTSKFNFLHRFRRMTMPKEGDI